MIAFLLLLSEAAPTAAPAPQQGVISAEDYPIKSMNAGEEGSVAAELLIDPNGRVDTCKTVISSGFSGLDEATCKILKTRARFVPSQREDGANIYGLTRAVITWRINAVGTGRSLAPDVELSLNKAPAGTILPADVRLAYIIGLDGRMRNCKADAGSPVTSQPLVDLACREIIREPMDVVRNSKGQAVEAGDTMTVRLNLKP